MSIKVTAVHGGDLYQVADQSRALFICTFGSVVISFFGIMSVLVSNNDPNKASVGGQALEHPVWVPIKGEACNFSVEGCGWVCFGLTRVKGAKTQKARQLSGISESAVFPPDNLAETNPNHSSRKNSIFHSGCLLFIMTVYYGPRVQHNVWRAGVRRQLRSPHMSEAVWWMTQTVPAVCCHFCSALR